jgi:hypothetical protein
MIARGDLHAVKVKTETGQEWRIDPASVDQTIGQVTDRDGHSRTGDGQAVPIETDSTGQEPEQVPEPLPNWETDTRIAHMEGFHFGQWSFQLFQQLHILSEELRLSREERNEQKAVNTALMEEIRQLRAQVERLSESRQDAPQQPPEAPVTQEPQQVKETHTEPQGRKRRPLWMVILGYRPKW